MEDFVQYPQTKPKDNFHFKLERDLDLELELDEPGGESMNSAHQDIAVLFQRASCIESIC